MPELMWELLEGFWDAFKAVCTGIVLGRVAWQALLDWRGHVARKKADARRVREAAARLGAPVWSSQGRYVRYRGE